MPDRVCNPVRQNILSICKFGIPNNLFAKSGIMSLYCQFKRYLIPFLLSDRISSVTFLKRLSSGRAGVLIFA
ncbi:Uncharacterized protein dnm_029490 [Desulfonema magnum]|uniref:Uncharacterized protein n=1 Tax=Desulfonema magnum TaxID=45655 RepID=A0A975GNI8_9BACT|nr:Uncharacterized protein dnm_029490 [Desulfonema magnum]